MSRKDYRKLAEALAERQPQAPGPTRVQWWRDVVAVADVLAGDNGRFDRDRFYEACGLEVAA